MHELGLIIEMGAMQPLSMKYENHRLHYVCLISKVSNGTTKMVTVNLVLKRRLRILTNKYHYRTEINI